MINEKIPVKWCEVVKLLKVLGYSPPKHYRVCLKESHSFLLYSPLDVCPFCYGSWNDCIDYNVLGLGIEEWFQTDEQCEKLMGHWKDKNSWLECCGSQSISNSSELWHGERFRELSWFWDPNKRTLLPGKCKGIER